MNLITRRELASGIAGSALPAPGLARANARKARWQLLPTPAYKGKQDDIFFVDGQTSWYGNGAGRVYGTQDGGDSWTLLWEQTGTYVRALSFVDAQVGILGNTRTNHFPGAVSLMRTALQTMHRGL